MPLGWELRPYCCLQAVESSAEYLAFMASMGRVQEVHQGEGSLGFSTFYLLNNKKY